MSPAPSAATSPGSALAPWGDAWHAAGAPVGTLTWMGAFPIVPNLPPQCLGCPVPSLHAGAVQWSVHLLGPQASS